MKSGEEIRYSPILTNIYKKGLQKLAFAVKNNITPCKLLNFIYLQTRLLYTANKASLLHKQALFAV